MPITVTEEAKLLCNMAVRLSMDDYSRLIGYAAAHGLSPAQAIRQLIRTTLTAAPARQAGKAGRGVVEEIERGIG